ncbi:2TM domain-containing protein [Aquimarina sp. MMG015]|nr:MULTISPECIES: 2TM domain-containing protein [unclassified Aquimarina]AXT54231.1 hypothetical protein D1815_00190 [Aquimarina sp. AD1]MBQ4804235.1 2TM domain-containing protein [Aquimarina sp. MMG015]
MTSKQMENSELHKRYSKAKKRVQDERSFFTHLALYIVINMVITYIILQLKHHIYDGYLFLNLISSPVIWGIFLLGHGLWVFGNKDVLRKASKPSFLSKKWEEKKIEELMQENN